MKTLELKLPTHVLLMWGLPEDAQNIAIDENYPDRVCFDINIDTITHPDYRLLPEGNWQLIGKLSELTEGDCRELVKETALYKKLNVRPYRFASYIDGFMGFQFALESFHSAVETEGYYVENPIPPFHERGKEWQEAESKTLPENTLIFKRA